MAKIYAPNKNYCGISASVPFVNGVGECDIPHILDWFRIHGYTVIENKKVESAEEPAGMLPEEFTIEETEPEESSEEPVLEEVELETPAEEVTESADETLNFEEMTKAQLQDLADDRSIQYNSHTTKEQLISALKKE